MRGNELNDMTIWVKSKYGFPIPMRGNEFVGGAGASPSFRFPIPMRGNEYLIVAAVGCLVGGFPIPMRGNESLYPWTRSGPTMVPDPHEG